MRDVYKNGFDFTKVEPVCIKNARVLLKGVIPSDFSQVISTDHLDEMRMCKVWEVKAVSKGAEELEKGTHVIVLKAGIDGLDPDSPRYGIVDSEDIAAKVML
jgi:hypothetical protein